MSTAFKNHDAIMRHQLVFARWTMVAGKQIAGAWLPAEAVWVPHAVCPDGVVRPGIIRRHLTLWCNP